MGKALFVASQIQFFGRFSDKLVLNQALGITIKWQVSAPLQRN